MACCVLLTLIIDTPTCHKWPYISIKCEVCQWLCVNVCSIAYLCTLYVFRVCVSLGHVPYVLVGAGTASFAAAKAIREADPQAKVSSFSTL